MGSGASNAAMATAIEQVAAGFAVLQQHGCEPADDRDAIVLIREFEQLRRLADSACVDLQGSIDNRRLHREDGHISAKVMTRHHGRLSDSEAFQRQQVIRLWATCPDVADQYRRGAIGTDHVRSLARVHANPRVRHAMAAKQEAFLREARADHKSFEQRIQNWMRLTDEDGPTPANQRAHEDRNVRIDQNFDLTWSLIGEFASQQGLQLSEIFDRYVEAETLADWEKARAEYGDAATVDHLPRTIRQRRADALWQVFIDAAANPNSAVPPDFVHNIVWDADTFEELVEQVLGPHDTQSDGTDSNNADFGDYSNAPADEANLFDGIDPDSMVCETIDGTPLEPTEAIINATVSKIRRVVVDAPSEKVDLGKARFFTGAARHAVKLKSSCCIWPGCTVPTSRCEADHLVEHSKDGRTNPGNGAPLCGKHNRHKQRGFTIFRDVDGSWHVIRPDGTPIPD